MVNIIPNLRFVHTWFGANIALGAYGNKEHIEQFFNGMYNHGGHNSEEIHYISDTFGYVLTTKPNVRQSMANAHISALRQAAVKQDARLTPESWSAAKAFGEKFMEEAIAENFLNPLVVPRNEYKNPAFAPESN